MDGWMDERKVNGQIMNYTLWVLKLGKLEKRQFQEYVREL